MSYKIVHQQILLSELNLAFLMSTLVILHINKLTLVVQTNKF